MCNAKQISPFTPSPTQPAEPAYPWFNFFGESTDPAGLARQGPAVLDVVLGLVVLVQKFAV